MIRDRTVEKVMDFRTGHYERDLGRRKLSTNDCDSQ